MQCPHCGEHTPDEGSLCVHCGKTLTFVAGSLFDAVQREARSEGTEWGPKLLRYFVGLVVLACVLGFGANYLKGRPLVTNEIDEPPLGEIPVPAIPKPVLPKDLPEAPLLEPADVPVPTSLSMGRTAFGSRSPRLRQLFLERNGGGADTEAAVKLGLEWFARTQGDDGGWDYKPYGVTQDHQAKDFRLGVSGLALLAYLGAGHTHTEAGPFRDTVDKALRYLLVQQKADGKFPGRMYEQGICTMALLEAYGLTNDTSLLEPSRRAVAAHVAAQCPSGGWVYGHRTRGDPSDTTVSGWQIMALKSAKKVGIEFPEEAYRKLTTYLRSVTRPSGTVGYCNQEDAVRPDRALNAMTAVGVNAHLFMGAKPTDERVQKCVAVLLRNLPDMPKPTAEGGWRPQADIYYWYHGSLALSRLGGQDWTIWNSRVKPILLKTQDKEGELKGSWRPCGDTWAKHAGRVYYTALAIMALEVYYRYE